MLDLRKHAETETPGETLPLLLHSPCSVFAAVRHWFRMLTDIRTSSENKEPLQAAEDSTEQRRNSARRGSALLYLHLAVGLIHEFRAPSSDTWRSVRQACPARCCCVRRHLAALQEPLLPLVARLLSLLRRFAQARTPHWTNSGPSADGEQHISVLHTGAGAPKSQLQWQRILCNLGSLCVDCTLMLSL